MWIEAMQLSNARSPFSLSGNEVLGLVPSALQYCMDYSGLDAEVT
jgi:hypothetical protein